MQLTEKHEIEKALHDEFYEGQHLSDEQLAQACAQDRLRLYRENPQHEYSPKQCQFQLLGDLNGKIVCDYACGDGEDSILLAGNGAAEVYAFDISSAAVEVTQRRAQVCGFASKIFATAANAEKLDYESNFFDAIYGSSTLHHIDIRLAANEVHRVLKPGGKAVFREPYEESRTLAALSKLVFAITPLRPDAVTPQRQLNHADVETLASIFSRVTVKPFGIFGRLDRILSNRSVLQNVHKLDRWLLDRFPTLGRIARHIVIECIK